MGLSEHASWVGRAAPGAAFSLVAWLAACGGQTGGPSSGVDGGVDSALPDGAQSPDVFVASTLCPALAPENGTPCTHAIQCEYGSDPDVHCDTVASCSGGAWSNPGTGELCPSMSDPSCPASYAALSSAPNASCTEGAVCIYPEARCTCALQCEMFGRQTPFFCCPDAPSGGAGCPSPRPRIGSGCSDDGAICDYGGCTGNVTLQCTGGTWQPNTMIACPG